MIVWIALGVIAALVLLFIFLPVVAWIIVGLVLLILAVVLLVPIGADVGYVVPVFHDFATWFQFYDGDDEFPASITYLFDENALQYMHYETLWYVMNALADRLEYYCTIIRRDFR